MSDQQIGDQRIGDQEFSGKEFSGRRVLVTGGGIGIGYGIALAFAQAGAQVAVTYNSHEPDAELRTASEANGGFVALRVDATSEDAVRDAVAEVADQLGGLDVLVNNVGGLVARKPLAEMDLEHWNTVWNLNVTSMFLCTREALQHLGEGGRIINIASLAGENGGGTGAVAYGTSKAAMIGFTRGLAKELGARGITVNALAPGFIGATPFHENFTPPEEQKKQASGIPVGRIGYPDDCASATLWLASSGAGFITGATIDVNGGVWFT